MFLLLCVFRSASTVKLEHKVGLDPRPRPWLTLGVVGGLPQVPGSDLIVGSNLVSPKAPRFQDLGSDLNFKTIVFRYPSLTDLTG